MDGIINGLLPEHSYSPPSPHMGETELGNKTPYANEQGAKTIGWELPSDSADSFETSSTSPSTKDSAIDSNGAGCDALVEKWRLIRLADKNKSQRRIYPTHDLSSAALGPNYSKFLEAFQQGLTHEIVNSTIPAKRSATASSHASKRRRQSEGAALPHPDQHRTPTIAPQRLATTATKSPTRAVPQETAPASDSATKLPATQGLRDSTEAKEQPSKKKGSGVYGANWYYDVTDEDKIPDYLSVAEKTADLEGRTTRRAYAKLTSNNVVEGSGKSVHPLSGNEVRKSGRARNNVDYAKISGSEGQLQGTVTSEQDEDGAILLAQEGTQTAPSTRASSTSLRSTLMPDHPSRPTSTSTATNFESLERPNRSWNSIVYEILATSETPLTFSQLVQGVKDRYPFFNSPSQKKILKSGPKNPLYFHEAFCKGEIVNGKQTWALRPGRFVDKKTGEVLTPPPLYTVSSPGLAVQAHGMEDHPTGDSTSISPPTSNPRSGNPRFGREILNSPEIPDSQDVNATASNAQKAESSTSARQSSEVEHPHDHSAALVSNHAQEAATAADDALRTPFTATDSSSQASHSQCQWTPINASQQNVPSASESPIAAGPEMPSLSNPTVVPTDCESPAVTPQSSRNLQIALPSESPIPSSNDENGRDTTLTKAQAASTSAPIKDTLSPAHVQILLGDCPAPSQNPAVILAAPMHSVYPPAYTQLDGGLADGEAGAK